MPGFFGLCPPHYEVRLDWNQEQPCFCSSLGDGIQPAEDAGGAPPPPADRSSVTSVRSRTGRSDPDAATDLRTRHVTQKSVGSTPSQDARSSPVQRTIGVFSSNCRLRKGGSGFVSQGGRATIECIAMIWSERGGGATLVEIGFLNLRGNRSPRTLPREPSNPRARAAARGAGCCSRPPQTRASR